MTDFPPSLVRRVMMASDSDAETARLVLDALGFKRSEFYRFDAAHAPLNLPADQVAEMNWEPYSSILEPFRHVSWSATYEES